MLYALVGEDAADSLEKRLAVRSAHLARLQVLQDEGRLILAGPMPAIDAADPGPAGFAGSLIVAEFVSLTAAQDWFAADPYVAAGVFVSTWVRPFKQVFPHCALEVSMSKIDNMRERLAALQPQSLEIIDDSHQHAGHGGFMADGSHFRMVIVSPLFEGKQTMARHRMVYAALGEMMQHDIHAMSIIAKSPAEAAAK